MKEGRIVYFEDHPIYRESVIDTIGMFARPHQIVGDAGDLAGAFGILDDMASGKLHANVILMDGNLSKSDTSGNDVREITDRIKQLGLAVRLVGLSSDPMEKYGVEVDIDITKKEFTVDLIKQILDELPEPEVAGERET